MWRKDGEDVLGGELENIKGSYSGAYYQYKRTPLEQTLRVPENIRATSERLEMIMSRLRVYTNFHIAFYLGDVVAPIVPAHYNEADDDALSLHLARDGAISLLAVKLWRPLRYEAEVMYFGNDVSDEYVHELDLAAACTSAPASFEVVDGHGKIQQTLPKY